MSSQQATGPAPTSAQGIPASASSAAASAQAAPASAISDEAFEKLLHDVTLTKNCRFYASRRTKSVGRSFLLAITALSVLNIAISLVSVVFANVLTDIQVKVIGVLVIIISVYLILLDLIAARESFDTRRFIFERGGNALLDLRNEMRLKRASPANNEYFYHKYERILDEYGLNHEDVDFNYARVFEKKDLSIIDRLTIWYHASSGVKSFISIMLPVLVVLYFAFTHFGEISPGVHK
jgi:hypothetical protein